MWLVYWLVVPDSEYNCGTVISQFRGTIPRKLPIDIATIIIIADSVTNPFPSGPEPSDPPHFSSIPPVILFLSYLSCQHQPRCQPRSESLISSSLKRTQLQCNSNTQN